MLADNMNYLIITTKSLLPQSSMPASNGTASRPESGFASPTNFRGTTSATNGHSILDEDEDVEMDTSEMEDDGDGMPSLSNGDSVYSHDRGSGNHVLARHSPDNNNKNDHHKNDMHCDGSI